MGGLVVSAATRPEAAVVMPAFNGGDTIRHALDSIATSVNACGRSVVISVADDGSTDATTTIVERFAIEHPSLPVVLTRHDENRGTGAARNTAAAAVEADVYLFLDQDDQYLEQHVGTCLEAFDRDRRIEYVWTDVQLDKPVHDDWVDSIAGALTQNLAVRRHAHRLVGGFLDDAATAAVGCDDVLYRRMLRVACVGVHVPTTTVRFRSYPGNAFDRQYEGKYRRPRNEAIDTMPPERAIHLPDVDRAFEQRMAGLHRRLVRLGRASGARR